MVICIDCNCKGEGVNENDNFENELVVFNTLILLVWFSVILIHCCNVFCKCSCDVYCYTVCNSFYFQWVMLNVIQLKMAAIGHFLILEGIILQLSMLVLKTSIAIDGILPFYNLFIFHLAVFCLSVFCHLYSKFISLNLS